MSSARAGRALALVVASAFTMALPRTGFADVPGLNDGCQRQYAAANASGLACETCDTQLGGSPGVAGAPNVFDLCKARLDKKGYKELCGERHGIAVSVHFCSSRVGEKPKDGGVAPTSSVIPKPSGATLATVPSAPPPSSVATPSEPPKSSGVSKGTGCTAAALPPAGTFAFGLALASLLVFSRRRTR